MRKQVIRVFLLSHLHTFFSDYGRDAEVNEMLRAEMDAAFRMDSNDLAVMAIDYLDEFGVNFCEIISDIDEYLLLKTELERHEMYEECAALKSIRNKITDSVAVGEIPWLNGTV